MIDERLLKHLLSWIFYTGFFLACSFFVIRSAGGSEVVDRIVAIVNDDIILLYDLNRLIKPYEERIKASGYSYEEERKMLFRVREDALNMLIDQKLADQEIKRYKISVSRQEIDKAIERMKEARFITDEDFREELSKQGVTLEEYHKNVKEQILREKLVNREVKSKIVVTTEDIKKYYESHIDEYAGEKSYHLRNIVMNVPEGADETEKLMILKKMEAVLSKLKQGESFEKFAKSYSDSPQAFEGGDLGLFKIDELSSQLQKVIKALEAGEFTDVLDYDKGYQILYVQEIKNTSGKSLEEATAEVSQKLYKEIVDKKYISWLEDLRSRSHIKIIR